MKTGYELLLPQGLTKYFDVVDVEEHASQIILHLDEKSLSESDMGDNTYLSKGFYPAVDIQDFPVRDRRSYLACPPSSLARQDNW